MKVTLTEEGKNSLDRAELLLAGIPGGVEKALKSAISRTAQHVRTESGKAVRKRYDISAANLRTEKGVSIRYAYTIGGGATATITFSGAKIPLYRYNGHSPNGPMYSSDLRPIMIHGHWRLAHPGIAASGHQLKGTAPTNLTNAFVAKFGSGHVGIFERTGGATSTGREEVKEIMGSSIPQMVGNEEVLEALSRDAVQTFDARMAHEVDALLNGWR